MSNDQISFTDKVETVKPVDTPLQQNGLANASLDFMKQLAGGNQTNGSEKLPDFQLSDPETTKSRPITDDQSTGTNQLEEVKWTLNGKPLVWGNGGYPVVVPNR